jgi:hypothetical protein
VLGLVLGLVVLCCSVGERGEPEGLVFSHKLHYEDEGLDCISCHASFDSEDDPGMPVKAQCMLCHADTDAEKPPERQIATLFDGNVYRARRISRLPDEVVFSHLAHAVDAELCSTCHEGIEQSERLDERMAVPMDDCMKCHGNLNVANECSTCHSEIREDRPPATHSGTWERTHGMVFRAGSQLTANRCDLCHLQSDCNDCHFNVQPENHTNYWRRRGHGLTARMDRQNCYACHRTDACDACHKETRPQSHGGQWGSPLNRHCLTCHLSSPAETGCNLCHAGTPSHSQGAPQPPDHVPGMNCRQCHGLTAPLPHVVKGEDCTICHP